MEERSSLLARLRAAIIPVKPEDSPAVKGIKHGAFYLFLVMASLVTATIVLAITFVL